MTLRAKAEAVAKDMLNERDSCDASREAWVVTFIDAIEKIAREFAEKALRGIYDVDDSDQDDPRARGGWRPKHAYEGTRNIESRYYREGFNEAIAAAIAEAEGDDT